MYRLTKASNKAVQYACKYYHYSKTVPVNTHWYNVYYNSEWCWVILYGTGANCNICKPFGLKQWEVIELVRVALNWKQENVSKPLSISLKLIKKDLPLCKLIVSYSDLDQNHVWSIYRATNWLYLWTAGIDSFSAFIIKWKKVHPKSVYWMWVKQSLESVKKHIDKNATKHYTKWKHKYIYILDQHYVLDIKSYPYPKIKKEYIHI